MRAAEGKFLFAIALAKERDRERERGRERTENTKNSPVTTQHIHACMCNQANPHECIMFDMCMDTHLITRAFQIFQQTL